LRKFGQSKQIVNYGDSIFSGKMLCLLGRSLWSREGNVDT